MERSDAVEPAEGDTQDDSPSPPQPQENIREQASGTLPDAAVAIGLVVSGAPETGRESSAIIKLKGLPYSATELQIRDFFSGYQIKTIHFVFDPDGRPSGLAFAEFENREDALRALSNKNGEFLGERFIKLLHVPPAEMEEQVRMGTSAVPGNAARQRSRLMWRQQQQQQYMQQQQQRNAMAYMGGGAGPMQRQQQRQQNPGPMAYTGGGMQPMQPMVPAPGLMVQPYGTAAHQAPLMWQSYDPASAPLAAAFQSLSLTAPNSQQAGSWNPGGGGPPGFGTLRGSASFPPPLDYSRQAAAAAAAAAVAQHQQQQHQAGATYLPQPSLHAGAGAGAAMAHAAAGTSAISSSCDGGGGGGMRSTTTIVPVTATAKVRGLPYRSTPVEILGFFLGYQYLPDSLQIGLDSLGRPSGEAWLTFVSAEEAMRAVRGLNRQYLGSRYLELSLC